MFETVFAAPDVYDWFAPIVAALLALFTAWLTIRYSVKELKEDVAEIKRHVEAHEEVCREERNTANETMSSIREDIGYIRGKLEGDS